MRRVGSHVFVVAWPFWRILLGFALAAAFGWLLGGSRADRVSTAAAGLELLGVGTVAYGLSRTRRDFNKPSWFQSVVTWFREIPGLLQTPKGQIIGAGGIGTSTAFGTAELTIKPGPETPLERRVRFLEEGLERLRDRVERDFVELGQQLNRAREALAREEAERQRAFADVTRKVEDLAVGDFHLESTGLVWLFVSLIVDTPAGTSATLAVLAWLGV